MNKQELIERIEGLKNLFGNKSEYIEIDSVIRLISELDEHEKVKIPQFVAEYIEFQKKNNFHVYGAMRIIEDHYDKRVPEWFYEGNIEKFCLAWIFGYEVEKEKRYLVKVKGMSEENTYLTFRFGHTWMLSNFEECEEFRLHHTRKELEEAGFGWVFDCPGIKIEEVK